MHTTSACSGNMQAKNAAQCMILRGRARTGSHHTTAGNCSTTASIQVTLTPAAPRQLRPYVTITVGERKCSPSVRMRHVCRRLLAAVQHAAAARAYTATPSLAARSSIATHAPGLCGLGTHMLSTSSPVPGLFGIQRLQQPLDYLHWARDAEARCLELVQQVLAAPFDASVIQLMDDISNEMCRVYDSAECCRHVHSSMQWRQGADAACQHLGRFIAELNHHQGLYHKLKDTLQRYEVSAQALNAAVPGADAGTGKDPSSSSSSTSSSSSSSSGSSSRQGSYEATAETSSNSTSSSDRSTSSTSWHLTPQQLQQFTPEVVVVGQKLLLDFEKSGIHLQDPFIRERLQQLMARNGHFSAQFNSNLTDPKQLGTTRIPQRLLPSSWHHTDSSTTSGSSSSSGGGLRSRLLGQQQPVEPCYTLSLAPGPLHHFLSHVPDEGARKQAYVAGNSTPAANLDLLDEVISCRSNMAALLGFDSYTAFRCHDQTLAECPAAPQGFLEGLSREVKPLADAEVAQLQQRKRKHTGQAGATLEPWDMEYYTAQARAAQPSAAAAAAAAPYLHLHSVLAGFSDLMAAVLGVRLRQVEAAPGEVWGPDVTKLLVEDCSGGEVLGTLYLDVGQGGAAPGSVLYPITCGRQQPDGSYQRPVLVLVTSCSGSTVPGQAVLSWRELRTLVHELGHAMHNLVSRTHFQHLWGTRCAHDLVEVPSHLWEHFVGDPRSLALLARHVSSRQPLPPQLVADLTARQRQQPALELQQQVLLSLLDLAYHGPNPPPAGATSDVLAQLSAEHSSVPYVPGTAPQARFSHLTIYGAGYYTYLYARCLAASLWRLYFQEDPLSRAAGDLISQRLLAPGGTIDPLPLLQGVLGTPGWQQQLVSWPGGGWSPNHDHLLQEATR